LNLEITLKPAQEHFLLSEARFPCFKAAIGTGKTFMLLLKIYNFCKRYPNSLGLIVRKEYTDLKDSTMRDFQKYFNCSIPSDKDFKMENGSIIMFRHGSELDVLKNINLSIAGIEQAEEFENDETFHFLRDRLRREGSPYRQMCVIANACGHNWVWKLWKNNPPSEQYDLSEMTTFENEDNLPADFIADLKTMEKEAPNHYKQFILNSDEVVEQDDYLFTHTMLKQSFEIVFNRPATKRILSCDVARFGQDSTVFTVLENRGPMCWEQIFKESHREKDLMWTTGRFIDLRREFKTSVNVVDDDGLGGGITDRLRELSVPIVDFKGGQKAKDEEMYGNRRSEGFFTLRDMIAKGYLKILNDYTLIDQLLTIRYKYNSKGQRFILSKDELRKEGIKSPDEADSLMMGVASIPKAFPSNTAPIQMLGGGRVY
jgi:hypothetical protein